MFDPDTLNGTEPGPADEDELVFEDEEDEFDEEDEDYDDEEDEDEE